MNIKVSKRFYSLLEIILISFLGLIWFYINYKGDIPPSYSYSIFNNQLRFAQSLSEYADGLLENNFSIILFPIIVILPTYFSNTLLIILTYIIGTLSMYYFITQIITKYVYIYNKLTLRISAIIVASCYVNTYYFQGGTFFNYSLYYALFPFILLFLEQKMVGNKQNIKQIINNSFLISLVFVISTLDIRTFIFNIIIFFIFFIYKSLQFHNFRSFLVLLKISLFSSFFYIVFNLKFLFVILENTGSGKTLTQSAVIAQIYIALQSYSPLFALSGSQTWFNVYNQQYAYIGLIPIIVGIFSLFRKDL